jgi:RNA polymerase sigma-70 factor (ECF subfamily)
VIPAWPVKSQGTKNPGQSESFPFTGAAIDFATKKPVLEVLSAPESGPKPRISDDDLIEAIVAGDRRAAAELYDRLIPVVDQTLYRILRAREADHEDLVQATFEQIVMTLLNRRYARACSLATWAGTLAAHIALNALRSRRVERKVVDRDESTEHKAGNVWTSEDIEGRVTAREQIERMRDALSTMKKEKAEAVVLHDVLGHDLAEIAVLTGVSVAAAQSRLVRRRKELFRKLGWHGKLAEIVQR